MPDLRLLRSDLGVFAAELGEPLEGWQLADLTLDAPITCLLWGRQMGKSRGLALVALHSALAAPGRRVLLVSGGGELGARRLLAEARRIATASPLLRSSVVDEAANLVTLSSGSEVRCVSASEPAIRGWRADRLLCDESQLLSADLLLSAALPTVSASEGGRVILAGTASVAGGPFYDLFIKGELGDERVRSSRRVSRLVGGSDPAPWQAPSIVTAGIEAMGPRRADAEHRCAWQSGSDSLFTRTAIGNATADYEVPALAELRGPARVIAGVDWGQTTDRSALVAVARLAVPDRRVFGVCCAHRWPAGAPLPDVVEEIGASPAHFDSIVAETNGLGGPCAQMLWRRIAERPLEDGGGSRRRFVVIEEGFDPFADPLRSAPRPRSRPPGFVTRKVAFTTTAASKAVAFSALRLLLEQGRLVLPAGAEDLARELLMLRVDLAPAGGERIEASSGHDDLAMALALSTLPYRRRDGEWRSWLAELAEPRRPLPDASGARAPGPTVRTGAGIEVPRTPAWASIDGTEVTAPGVRPPEPAGHERPVPEMVSAR